MTLSDIAKQILGKNSGVMAVRDIAEQALKIFHLEDDIEVLKNKISAAISSDIRRNKDKSDFRRIKNKRGGYCLGQYKLKATKTTPKILHLTPPPVVSTQYTGKAGEHAVLSELLFYGFNASLMSVDDGIDIVANKDKTFFHIQVKTSSANNGNDCFSFNIARDKYKKFASGTTCYIFVMRRTDKSRYHNDFAIISSSEINSYIARKIVNDAANLSFRVKIELGEFILNNKEVINSNINRFDLIR